MVLFSELAQFLCSRMFGKHLIAEEIDETRTWEGLLGGAAVTALLGSILFWATPFKYLWQVATMSVLISVMSSAGALTLAAIRRAVDRARNTHRRTWRCPEPDRCNLLCRSSILPRDPRLFWQGRGLIREPRFRPCTRVTAESPILRLRLSRETPKRSDRWLRPGSERSHPPSRN